MYNWFSLYMADDYADSKAADMSGWCHAVLGKRVES